MEEPKIQQLPKLFPDIFKVGYIETGDGWYDLLFNLFTDMQKLINEWKIKEIELNDPEAVCECTYVRELHTGEDHLLSCPKEKPEDICDCSYICKNFTLAMPKIEQCKEKFAGLRVYCNFYVDGLDELIDKYAELSFYTCEVCGNSGEVINKRSWLTTLCKEHWG